MLVVGRIPVAECLKAGKRRPRTLYYLEGACGLDEILVAADLPAEPCERQTLDEQQIRALAELGQQVQEEFGALSLNVRQLKRISGNVPMPADSGRGRGHEGGSG